jgi:peptidoglycan/xylan/chitin deacetylase (PgdA/CDA1 family)
LNAKSLLKLRHLLCGLVARWVLRTDRVRRAQKQALSGEVITAIYFHNPSRQLFEESVSWLMRKGYTFISAEELVDILQNRRPFPKGAAWISLDDGYSEWVDNVLPVVVRQKIPVTLFIPTGIIADSGVFPWISEHKGRESLNVDELQRMARLSEIELGGHTISHTLTVRCTAQELELEIGGCKRALQQWTGKQVVSFSYPEGRYDGRERVLLQRFQYSVAATTQPHFIRKDTDPMLVPRFCVPDNVTFPEAVCNMLGVWRPVLDSIKAFLRVSDPWHVNS